MTSAGQTERARKALVEYLNASGVEWEPRGDSIVVSLPGEHKLRTTVSLEVGAHALTVNAFVARNPDESHQDVYRWLLERNRRMFAVAFSIDHLGDIYLTGRLPLESVTSEELDRLLGSVLEYADGAFNPILELGFHTAIRREWAWRTERGEPTGHLAAFAHLAEQVADASSASVE